VTCQEAIALLGDYLELTLSDAALADLERHLADCAPCRAYLATYRATKGLAAEAQRVPMPDELKERLRQLLVRELRGGGS
jgi:anti-sigma factor RsiW